LTELCCRYTKVMNIPSTLVNLKSLCDVKYLREC